MEVHVRTYIVGVLLAGLLSLVQADTVKMKDGHSYQGKVQCRDADIIKFKPADSGEVKVFYVKDVEEVLVDSSPTRPVPLENPSSSSRQSAEYWEKQGYTDGSRTTGMKSALAAAGGCIGVPVGGFLGLLANGTSQACLLGVAVGGGAGCLGGRELGSLGQREAVSPTPDSAFRDAYRRGYQRAALCSDGVPVAAGAGGVLVSVAVLIGLWILAFRSAMIT
jgi:hypothetical protein